ncbi:hypothetical protein C1H46_045685 [Malus baccata]|uniref:Uncharacterized protein n=1 Tax=Malus baccata TaxID=106549 RepID=A0A540K4I3_MALBA|nr:hypothetical protein C1H46_045685 [Malus baccata]
MRLSEHHGKKYQFIEEALAFVGDVCDASRLVSPESLYGPPIGPSGEKLVASNGKKRNILIRFLISSITFVKKTLKLDNTGGILGNAALVALSMIAFVHLNQVGIKEHQQKLEDKIYINRNVRKTSPSIGHSSNLDVLLARG